MKKALPVLYIFAAATAVGFSSPAMADKGLSKTEVEAVVKKYLDEHPDVIIEAMKKYQMKQEAEVTQKAAKALKDHGTEVTEGKYSPIAGNPKGDVTVVEFFDYHCGYCKKMLPVMTELMQDDSKVKMTFKELPILSEDSELAARASLAVNHLKPGKYFAYHTALMQINGKFEESKLIDEAKKLGVNEEEMKTEMKSDWVKAELKKNKELAAELNIRGTPGFIVGDTLIPGAASLDDIKKAIKQARHEEAKEGKKADDKDEDKLADKASSDE